MNEEVGLCKREEAEGVQYLQETSSSITLERLEEEVDCLVCGSV